MGTWETVAIGLGTGLLVLILGSPLLWLWKPKFEEFTDAKNREKQTADYVEAMRTADSLFLYGMWYVATADKVAAIDITLAILFLFASPFALLIHPVLAALLGFVGVMFGGVAGFVLYGTHPFRKAVHRSAFIRARQGADATEAGRTLP